LPRRFAGPKAAQLCRQRGCGRGVGRRARRLSRDDEADRQPAVERLSGHAGPRYSAMNAAMNAAMNVPERLFEGVGTDGRSA
jgi:hypothetical protein